MDPSDEPTLENCRKRVLPSILHFFLCCSTLLSFQLSLHHKLVMPEKLSKVHFRRKASENGSLINKRTDQKP